MGKHVKLEDTNTACTGIKPFCMNPPESWNGSLPTGATRSTLLAAGWTDDVDCKGFAAAGDCVTVSPSTATIDRVGLFYQAGSHAFIAVSATKPVEVRVYNSAYNSGWVTAGGFNSSIGTAVYEQRAVIQSPATGSMVVEVRVIGSDIVRQITNVSFGATNRDENLYPAVGGSGSCSIEIQNMQYDYSNSRMTAVVASSGLKGKLQYSINKKDFYDQVTAIINLIPGDYTLYVQDSGGATCSAQRAFTIDCQPPVQNEIPILTVVNNRITGFGVNFGVATQQFRYVLREVNTEGNNVVFSQSPVGGGPRSFALNLPYSQSNKYLISCQILGSLTCETVVDPFVSLDNGGGSIF